MTIKFLSDQNLNLQELLKQLCFCLNSSFFFVLNEEFYSIEEILSVFEVEIKTLVSGFEKQPSLIFRIVITKVNKLISAKISLNLFRPTIFFLD